MHVTCKIGGTQIVGNHPGLSLVRTADAALRSSFAPFKKEQL
jgi:hypothetical protein